jgi:hypothetical protein
VPFLLDAKSRPFGKRSQERSRRLRISTLSIPKDVGRVEEHPSEVRLKRFLFQKTKLDSCIVSIVAGLVDEPG